jgi:hypothetical protein
MFRSFEHGKSMQPTMRSQNVAPKLHKMRLFLRKSPLFAHLLSRQPDVLLWKMIAGHHSMVHLTGGSLRVFKHFSWLGVASGKMALSFPAHQQVPPAVETVEKISFQKLFFKSGTKTLKSGWSLVFRTTFWQFF